MKDTGRWDELRIAHETIATYGLGGCVFQIKEFEQEFIEYYIFLDNKLVKHDHAFELVDSTDPDGLFKKRLKRVPINTTYPDYTGTIKARTLKDNKLHVLSLTFNKGTLENIIHKDYPVNFNK